MLNYPVREALRADGFRSRPGVDRPRQPQSPAPESCAAGPARPRRRRVRRGCAVEGRKQVTAWRGDHQVLAQALQDAWEAVSIGVLLATGCGNGGERCRAGRLDGLDHDRAVQVQDQAPRGLRPASVRQTRHLSRSHPEPAAQRGNGGAPAVDGTAKPAGRVGQPGRGARDLHGGPPVDMTDESVGCAGFEEKQPEGERNFRFSEGRLTGVRCESDRPHAAACVGSMSCFLE